MFLLDDCSSEAVLSDSCNRSCWGGGGGGGEALTTQDQIDLYEGGGGSQAACIAKSKIILNLLLHCRTINQKTNMFVSLFRFLYRVCTTKTNKKECFH